MREGACTEVLSRVESSAYVEKKKRRGEATGGRFDRKTCDGLTLERRGATHGRVTA